MDKQIQKLAIWIDLLMNQPKEIVVQMCGKPNRNSDDEVFFYCQYKWAIFKKKIAVIFDDDRVTDIILTESIFGVEIRNIYYFEKRKPSYTIQQVF